MSIRYEFDGAIVLGFLSGVVTDEEVVDCTVRLLDDPGRRVGSHQLWDMRGIDMRVTPDGVRRMAEITRSRGEEMRGSRVAVVVDSDLAYGLARMYELLCGDAPFRFGVFRSVEEARAWIGRENEVGA